MLSLKDWLLFYFYRPNLQVNIHSCMAWVWLFPSGSVLTQPRILFIVHKAKTPYNDLYSLQVMHTREGVLSQREAPLMKLIPVEGIFSISLPSIRRLFEAHLALLEVKAHLTHWGAHATRRVSGCSLLLLVSCAAVTNYH